MFAIQVMTYVSFYMFFVLEKWPLTVRSSIVNIVRMSQLHVLMLRVTLERYSFRSFTLLN